MNAGTAGCSAKFVRLAMKKHRKWTKTWTMSRT